MTGSTRKKTDVLSPTLSQFTLSELATQPLVLVILVRRPGDVLAVQRARLAAACTSDGSLTCRCAACSPRGRCTSLTSLSLQLCGVLAAKLRGAVHTAYSLKAYSCDGRQRGKTQPACVNGDSHLAFSSTASHPHTLVTGISFAHLSLRLFSTAHHLYGVTIITTTWKRKRLITLRTRR